MGIQENSCLVHDLFLMEQIHEDLVLQALFLNFITEQKGLPMLMVRAENSEDRMILYPTLIVVGTLVRVISIKRFWVVLMLVVGVHQLIPPS